MLYFRHFMPNPPLQNWIFLFLLWIALVWAWRTVHLLKALRHMPHIDPAAKPLKFRKVSVIVPMKNEETNARACCESLKAQDYPDLEILIANDNSTDRTGEILKSMGVHYTSVPPTPPGWTGKNFALHTAVQKASGDWFLFTDADQRFRGDGPRGTKKS